MIGASKAHIDPGWHVYSTSHRGRHSDHPHSWRSNAAIEKVRAPSSRRRSKPSIPSFNWKPRPTKASRGFLIELQLKKDAPAGPVEISVEVALPDLQRHASASRRSAGPRPRRLTVDPRAAPASPRHSCRIRRVTPKSNAGSARRGDRLQPRTRRAWAPFLLSLSASGWPLSSRLAFSR